MIKKIGDMKLKELYFLKEYITSFESIDDVVLDLDREIEDREKWFNENPNNYFDLDFFRKTFTHEEMMVLEINGIHNLTELIDADLGEMKMMTSSIREHFEFMIRTFDLTKFLEKNKEDYNGKGK